MKLQFTGASYTGAPVPFYVGNVWLRNWDAAEKESMKKSHILKKSDVPYSLKINPLLLTIQSVYGIIRQARKALFQCVQIFENFLRID